MFNQFLFISAIMVETLADIKLIAQARLNLALQKYPGLGAAVFKKRCNQSILTPL